MHLSPYFLYATLAINKCFSFCFCCFFFHTNRYSEKVLNRRNPAETKLEYTTERIRHELAEKEALLKSNEVKTISDSNDNSLHTESEATTIAEEGNVDTLEAEPADNKIANVQTDEISTNKDQKFVTKDTEHVSVDADAEPNVTSGSKDPATMANTTESKSKKKRRKKSMMKKKASLTMTSAPTQSTTGSNASRKSSSSSSAGSASIVPPDNDFDTDPDPQQLSNATSLSIEDFAKSESVVAGAAASVTAPANDDNMSLSNVHTSTMDTPRMCDLHFFSDTEVAASPYGSRPSTPIQSDSEFEMSQREKNSDPMTSSTASWKWGEFPITPKNKPDSDAATTKDAKQAERNSTLNTMLSFMKETMRMRKSTSDGGVYLSDLINSNEGLDPDVVAKYFPPPKNESFSNLNDCDDHESGNGTSPHSPSSVENGISKNLFFDFDQDGKFCEK